MARIKLGTTIAGISGTIGGVTFSRNKSGPYAKGWARGPHTVTQLQSQTRTAFSAISQGWSTLTAGQRVDWDDWAALPAQEQYDVFGDPYYLSGFQWFRKWNLWRASVGDDVRDDAPTDTQPPAPIAATLTFTVTIGSLQEATLLYPPDEFEDAYLVILAGRRTPPSNITQVPTPRFVTAPYYPPAASYEFFAALEAAFGVIQEDSRYILTVYNQSAQGYRSAGAITSAEVQVI